MANSFSWQTWMKAKVTLAQRLASGECGASYPEAVIILCSAISAIAAVVWPGEGIDRKRFVELFKDFSDAKLHPTRISLPLLIGHLRTSGKAGPEQTLREEFMGVLPAQILRGDDVDEDEDSVLAVCPGLSRKELRSFSYSSVLYKEVRSTFVHEYRLGGKADPWPMADDSDTVISYGNWHGEPDRHIHYPIGWLCLSAESIAVAADSRQSSFPWKPPQRWWVEGV